MTCAVTRSYARGSNPVWRWMAIVVCYLCCSCGRPSAEVEQLKIRAERGEAAAQFSLAYRHLRGVGVEKDPAAAAHWFRKAAEQGDIGAEYFLGSMLFYGEGIPRDMAEGEKWLSKAGRDNPKSPSYQFYRQ